MEPAKIVSAKAAAAPVSMPERTKSFSGCWSCRERKIKCNLGKPSCKQCLEAQIKCKGYSVRLYWDGTGKTGLRRTLDFVQMPPDMMYSTYDELDEALDHLDSMEPRNDDGTVAIGPFCVFNGSNSRDSSYPRTEASNMGSQLHRGSSVSAISPLTFGSEPPGTGSYPNFDPLGLRGPGQLNPGPALSPLETHPQDTWRTADDILLLKDSTFSFDVPDDYATGAWQESDTRDLLFESLGRCGSVMDDQNDTCLYLTPLAKHLLANYQANVVPRMSIIIHPRNVWHILFIPRVYAAVGDIICTGTTTFARYCILHTVAAISAYHLAQNLQDKRSSQRDYYRNIGDQLHRSSKALLSECLKGRNVGKYKDFIAALLCMTNVEFITGALIDNEVPLATMRKLISLRLIHRPKMSRKAALLHKACAISVLLTNAAGSWPKSPLVGETQHQPEYADDDWWIDTVFADMAPIQSGADRRRVEMLQKLESRQTALSYMETTNELEEYFLQYTSENANFQEAFSMELMHGIPDLLAFLFKEAVTISRAALWERENMPDSYAGDSSSFSVELSQKCTVLEAALQTWRLRFRPMSLEDVPRSNKDDSETLTRRLSVINHHTLAFYEALVLYHYRVAKGVNLELLQPYVVRIVEHLEAITYENVQNGRPLAIPCLFPGFIGACEIQKDDFTLRRRYDLWFHDMERYGLASYSQTVGVIEEIRNRRSRGETCDWWTLAKEKSIAINLH